MIERVEEPHLAAAWCAGARDDGLSLGFVPTMGALHEGHLALVRASVAANDRTVVSVFVNPLQFNEQEDFERYPRDLEADARMLDDVGCDVVFTGTLAQFFPGCEDVAAAVDLEDPGPAAAGLEGDHRPGHLAGVATIVRRLFELVRPDVAYFGEKDFQQTLVVRHVAERLGRPRIAVIETEREPSGLARSSRNALLEPAARADGAAIARGLFAAREAYRAGVRDPDELVRTIGAGLAAPLFEVEYVELRDPAEWARGPLQGPLGPSDRVRALVSVRLGGVRLIDNLRLDGAS